MKFSIKEYRAFSNCGQYEIHVVTLRGEQTYHCWRHFPTGRMESVRVCLSRDEAEEACRIDQCPN